MNDDAQWLIGDGDGGCPVHGDRAMAVCELCGAEFCALCFPAGKLCPCCAAEETDDDALAAPSAGAELPELADEDAVGAGEAGDELTDPGDPNPAAFDEAGADAQPDPGERDPAPPRRQVRPKAAGSGPRQDRPAASPASSRVRRRSDKKRSPGASRTRRGGRSRRA